jgi:hypothetical protein
MKTSEFIERALEIDGVGYVDDNHHGVFLAIKDLNKMTLAGVKTKEMYAIDTSYSFFKDLYFWEREKLFSLLAEYAMTPLEEREEPKKYKLKHKLVKECSYLNYAKGKGEWRFSTEDELGRFKTSFTIQEWESLTEQTWEDLLLQFKAIEV